MCVFVPQSPRSASRVPRRRASLLTRGVVYRITSSSRRFRERRQARFGVFGSGNRNAPTRAVHRRPRRRGEARGREQLRRVGFRRRQLASRRGRDRHSARIGATTRHALLWTDGAQIRRHRNPSPSGGSRLWRRRERRRERGAFPRPTSGTRSKSLLCFMFLYCVNYFLHRVNFCAMFLHVVFFFF